MPFFRNLDAWTRAARAEQEKIHRAARGAMPLVGREVRDMVQARIPPNVETTEGMPYVFPGYAATGRMKSSFVSSPIQEQGDQIVARVGLRSGYAAIDNIKAHVHEYGAVIRPRRARALRFEINGRVIFAQQVWIRPKGYFAAAWQQAQREVPAILHARFLELYS